MRRIALALAALLFLTSARDASADEESPSPSPPTPLRSVRVNVRVQRDSDIADARMERGGTWTTICRVPCAFDAATGEHGRIDFLNTSDDPLPFTVPGDGTTTYDVEVHRPGNGYLVGGLAAFGAGAISLALGMAIIRGAGKEDLFGEANGFMGRLLLILGGASGVTGTVLVLKHSSTPFLAGPGPAPAPSPSSPPVPGVSAFQLVWTGHF